VSAPIDEAEGGAEEEVSYGARDDHLVRGAEREGAVGEVDLEPADILLATLDLARVHS
jgi:hypothetical protein